MKNIYSLFLLLFFAASLHGQETDPQNKTASKTEKLKVGEVLTFGDTSVQFIKVISDSRCPKNVECIWQGEAKVLLGMIVEGRKISEVEVVIASGDQSFPVLQEQGLLLNVYGLSPYPEVGRNHGLTEYRLGMQIGQLKSD